MTGSRQSRPMDTHGGIRQSELRLRILSSFILAGIALGAAYCGGLIFAAFWTIAGLLVLREWLSIVRPATSRSPIELLIGIGSVMVCVSLAYSGAQSKLFALVPAIFGGVFICFLSDRGVTERLWKAGGVLYASVIAFAPIMLRGDSINGLIVIVWLYLVVWISDIGAFFVGRTLGGPKLWPAVSPKKTWSGMIGGLLFGTIVSAMMVSLWRLYFGPVWFGGLTLVLVSFSASLLAEAGDLFESAMKRYFGVKDSSHLIPGHGGVMDRLDSFASAVLFAYLIGGFEDLGSQ